MAKQDTYATVTPGTGDLVTGVDVSDPTQDPDGSTKNFTVDGIARFWRTDTISLSADTSVTWDIPAGVTEIELNFNSLAASTTSVDLYIEMIEAADGTTKGTFQEARVYSLRGGSSTAASDISADRIVAIGGDPSTASNFAGTIKIRHPRSSTVETRASGHMSATGSNAAAAAMQVFTSIAASAEDHSKVQIRATGGTFTGTVHVDYK